MSSLVRSIKLKLNFPLGRSLTPHVVENGCKSQTFGIMVLQEGIGIQQSQKEKNEIVTEKGEIGEIEC